MMENNLQELTGSRFVLAPETVDITGWSVLDQRGQHIGLITGLLFDEEQGSVRYLIISLNDSAEYNAKKIVVPIGLAESKPAERTVMLPEVRDEQIASIPAYNGIQSLGEDFETKGRYSLEEHSTAPYDHP